jgi:hypothetical protein
MMSMLTFQSLATNTRKTILLVVLLAIASEAFAPARNVHVHSHGSFVGSRNALRSSGYVPT